MNCVRDGRPARFQCSHCLRPLCEACVRVADLGRQKVVVCPFCGGQLNEIAEAAESARSFWYYLVTAPIYPLMGKGMLLIVLNGIFIGACFVGGYFFLLLGVFIQAFAIGYAYWLLFNAIQKNALEQDEPPSMPEFAGFGEVFSALLKMLALNVAWAGPAVLVASAALGEPGTLLAGIVQALGGAATLWGYVVAPTPFGPVQIVAGIGLLFYPMSLLAVATFNSYRGIHPVPLLLTMVRAPIQYLVCCVCFYAVVALMVFIWAAVAAATGSVIVVLLAPLVFVYVIYAVARILGGLHAANKARFGWVRT